MNIVIDTANPFGNGKELESLVFENFWSDRFHRTIIDRGNSEIYGGLDRLPFPSYSPDRCNADDSILLQKACDHLRADLYISTLPTPLSTPTVLLLAGKYCNPSYSERPLDELALAVRYCEAILVKSADRNLLLNDLLIGDHNKTIGDLESYLIRRSPRASDFYLEWARLRVLQAEVDSVVWSS